jgi:pyruvate dehydrogenase (quinone)
MGGAPKFEETQVIPDIDYAGLARGLGLEAVNVDTPEEIGPAWDRALAADQPVLIDVRCDPEVPPIPPHATFEQAKSAAEAVVKGDPNAWHMVVQGVKTKAQEFLPGR